MTEERITLGQVLVALTPRVFVTRAIVVINAAVFVFMAVNGASPISPSGEDLLRFGANFGPDIAAGQWWRILSAAFVHAGLIHIAFNMYALWGAGQLAERLFGNLVFALIYLLAAVGGSLCSVAWKPLGLSVGASGAVFGVYGALLAFTTVKHRQLPLAALSSLRNSVLAFVGYNLLFGLTQSFIDNAAHVGGLVTGMLAGALGARDLLRQETAPTLRVARVLLVALALVGLAAFAKSRVESHPAVAADRLTEQANDASKAGDYRRAISLLDQAIAKSPDFAPRYDARGWFHEQLNEREEALADYEKAIAHDNTLATAHAHRCGLMAVMKKEGAEEACNRAVAVAPTQAEAQLGKALVLARKGDVPNAMAAVDKAIEADNEYPAAYEFRAGIRADNKDWAGARADADKWIALDERSAKAFAFRCMLHGRLGDDDGALTDCGRSIQLDPKGVDARLLREVSYEHAGRFAEALADLEVALAATPDNAGALNNRAWCLLQLGRLDEALASVNRSLAQAPDDPAALGTRCWTRFALGDRRGAKADCLRAVELAGSAPGSRLDRGFLAFMDGRYGEAIRLWEEQVSARPSDKHVLAPWIDKARALDKRP